LLQANETNEEWETVIKPDESGGMTERGQHKLEDCVAERVMPQKRDDSKPEIEKKENWQWLEKPSKQDVCSASRS